MRQRERSPLPLAGRHTLPSSCRSEGITPRSPGCTAAPSGSGTGTPGPAIRPHPDGLFRPAEDRNPGRPDLAPLPSTPLRPPLPVRPGPGSGRTLSVHQCFCPQCHPDFVAVRFCIKAGGHRLFDPCAGKIPGRQITGKLCVVGLRAGRDKLSQVKLHSTPHKRLLC